MTQWTVTFQDAPEMIRIRAGKARRRAHIAFVQGRPELQIGGPLALAPMQDFPGAIWTIQAGTRAEVERLILSDPYFIPSLRRYRIVAWNSQMAKQVIGQPISAGSFGEGQVKK